MLCLGESESIIPGTVKSNFRKNLLQEPDASPEWKVTYRAESSPRNKELNKEAYCNLKTSEDTLQIQSRLSESSLPTSDNVLIKKCSFKDQKTADSGCRCQDDPVRMLYKRKIKRWLCQHKLQLEEKKKKAAIHIKASMRIWLDKRFPTKQSYSPSLHDLNCHRGPSSFDNIFGSMAAKAFRKIAMSEKCHVYSIEGRSEAVFKIIPISMETGDESKNRTSLKLALMELMISQVINELQNDFVNCTSSFLKLLNGWLVKDAVPDYIKDADEEVEHLGTLPQGPFLVLKSIHAGIPLLQGTGLKPEQILSVICQLSCAFEAAENRLNFEYRYFDISNVLLKPTRKPDIKFIVGGEKIKVPSFGLKVTIIGFSQARLTIAGKVICAPIKFKGSEKPIIPRKISHFSPQSNQDFIRNYAKHMMHSVARSNRPNINRNECEDIVKYFIDRFQPQRTLDFYMQGFKYLKKMGSYRNKIEKILQA